MFFSIIFGGKTGNIFSLSDSPNQLQNPHYKFVMAVRRSSFAFPEYLVAITDMVKKLFTVNSNALRQLDTLCQFVLTVNTLGQIGHCVIVLTPCIVVLTLSIIVLTLRVIVLTLGATVSTPCVIVECLYV